MNILILTALEYPHVGGVSTHIDQLILGLKRQGHSVETLSRSNLSKIQLFLLKIIAGLMYALGFKSYGYLYYHRFIGHLLFKKLKKLKHKFQVIHLHSPSFIVEWLQVESYIMTCHADMTNEMLGQNKIKKNSECEKKFLAMEKLTFVKAKKIICVDERLSKFVIQLLENKNQDLKKIIEMKNFIDVDTNKELPLKALQQEHITLLCPRRLVIKNGVQYAIEAFKYLPENFKLFIAGDGEELDALQSLTARLKLSHIHFLGSQNPEQMKNLLSKMDLMIIPSITVNGLQEATSIAALEGFLYGLPVIASNIGGLKQMIQNGETGMLFEEKDVATLAEQIKKVAQSHELFQKLRLNALKNLKDNFSLDSRIKDIEIIYNE